MRQCGSSLTAWPSVLPGSVVPDTWSGTTHTYTHMQTSVQRNHAPRQSRIHLSHKAALMSALITKMAHRVEMRQRGQTETVCPLTKISQLNL